MYVDSAYDDKDLLPHEQCFSGGHTSVFYIDTKIISYLFGKFLLITDMDYSDSIWYTHLYFNKHDLKCQIYVAICSTWLLVLSRKEQLLSVIFCHLYA